MNYNKHIAIAFALIVIISMPVQSKLLGPWEYPEGTCELAAKEYRNVYGGDLMFLQPLKEDGSFEFGDYAGAWLNKAWNKEQGIYYIYYPSGNYFNNTNEIRLWYYINTGKDSKIYNVNSESVPFGIIYHY